MASARPLVTRIGLVGLLCCLVAVPLLVKRLSGRSDAPASDDAAKKRYGFALVEVAKAAGIDFVHQAPTLDPKLEHIMPQVASMGAAVSVVDFDRDGWHDLYVVNSGEGSLNRLYRNRRDGSFEDVAGPAGLADLNRPGTGVCMGSVWADYDNDGYEDVLVYKWGRPELFRNEGGKTFARVSDAAGLPSHVNANSAVWFDYDRDGNVDLFLAGYWGDGVDLWKLDSTKIMPESFEYAENGGRKYLLQNEGGGRFRDVTAEAGIDSRRWTLAVAAADLCGTGYPDLFLANDYGVPELFANEGGKRFRDIGKSANVSASPKSGMSVAFGDVLNQGCLAVYKTNISEEGVLIQGNDLWLPTPGAHGKELSYTNLAREMKVELGGWSWGAQFGDFNNDGWQDLYCTNGYVSDDRTGSYWYDFSKIAGGHNSIISDAKNWPPMKGRSLSGYQQKKLWLNDGAAGFTEVAQAVGAKDVYDGRAVALADLWNRGAVDVVVANQKGPLLVYRNDAATDNAWLAFELEGTRSNRSAIGAQVKVFWDGRQQLQEVSGGSGFSSQNSRRLHYGLGKQPKLEKVVVRWPSGKTQELTGLALNTLHAIKEPA